MFDFIGRKKTWFIVSLVLFVITVGSWIGQGLNLGIDFTGGIQLDAAFSRPVSAESIRSFLGRAGYRDNSVVGVGSNGREYLINLPALSEQTRTTLFQNLSTAVAPFRTVSLDKVTAVVRQQLISQGIWSVLVASIGIILYMAFRFDFKFALTGIVAVFYDALISVGMVSLLRIQITSAFVAAVLTIIGYSINDRIIIFDRIRENLKLSPKEDLASLVNRSLNQTLVRSINTAVIVILAMLAILIFGGASTRDFAATMAIGVFFGAYSSIFLASPLWESWMQRERVRAAQAQGGKNKSGRSGK